MAVRMDDRQREAAAAFARARLRADRALASAALAGKFGALAEQRSRQATGSLPGTAARRAAIYRRSQRRLVASAQRHAAYAERLRRSMDQPGGSHGAGFLAAIARVCGESGVVITLSGRRQPQAMVAATDGLAQAACDLERGYGEGPATDAVARRAPVQAAGDLAAVWPLYGPAATRLGIQAVSAAPLCLHGRCLGSVTVLDPHPEGRGRRRRLWAGQLAGALVYTLLAGDILTGDDGLPGLPLAAGDRALTHQAAGIVAAESGLEIADALALIRARAFADSQPVATIAARVVGRQLHLSIAG